MKRREVLASLLATAAAPMAVLRPALAAGSAKAYEVSLSDADWRKRLSPQAYQVLRHADTEYPWSSKLEYEHRKGVYSCAGCSLDNFSSDTKFESGSGWPSFWKPLNNAVQTAGDTSHDMDRTEVRCRRCGGHLGHVFKDGPPPTGLRYCMNGVALKFRTA